MSERISVIIGTELRKMFRQGWNEAEIAAEWDLPVATVRYHCREARWTAEAQGTLTASQRMQGGRKSVLTDEQRAEVRFAYMLTGSVRPLARLYRVSRSVIENAINDLIGTRTDDLTNDQT